MATKAKALKRGDRVLVKDRLWVLVNQDGRIMDGPHGLTIYKTRSEALANRAEGEFVLRLDDLHGSVI